MKPKSIAERIGCECFFCQSGKEHKHTIAVEWGSISSLLLKAESLDPRDTVKLESCNLCGHTRKKVNA